MKHLYRDIIKQIGEDPDREGLLDTPERAAKAMRYLTSGYHDDVEAKINQALFDSTYNEIIIIKDIELYSLCEHHLLPFFGRCHIGYIPQGKILGLSKFARVVDHFAKRLQVQEHLTQQIADYIMDVTAAEGVGVIVEAKHMCMMMRGVQKQNSSMKTSVMLGSFYDDAATRAEFLSLLKS